MITKNEFYGAYLIAAGKADAAKPIGIYIERADAAWSVIEELQKGTLDGASDYFELPVDDNAKEPKLGKLSFFTDEQMAELNEIVNKRKCNSTNGV